MQRRFGGRSLVATAAYNAGPNAAQRWLGADPVPGDLWLTRIPYTETRNYVRRVLTYRVIYRARLGLPPLRLHAVMRAVGG
jgi:soluble lytic murein transglycosylase